MSIYFYKVRDGQGRISEGTIDAISTDAVAEVLLAKKLAILEISQQSRNRYAFITNLFVEKVSSKDLVIFFRQLSVMTAANLPLVRSLKILTKQTKNKHFREIIAGVADEIDGGSPLSSALEFSPEIFSKFFINIIRSGETSGRLSEVMNYLADQKEKDYDIESKVKGAMIYPAFILAVLVVVAFVVVTFVIPNITAVLIESGAPLPLITRILIGSSTFLRGYWWLVLLLAISSSVAWNYWIKTPVGRGFIDELKLRIPVFGRIFRNIYVVRICLSFATLVKGGVPIAVSLGVVKEVVDNVVYEKILTATSKSVEEGNQVAESLSDNPYIPDLMSQMITVGEESGKLEEVLEKIADFYSREIDNDVRNLSSLIEPVIMVFLGLAVGVFVAAVILPMWQLSATI